jgi:hypothetical protein
MNIQFCDLCNESVAEKELKTGSAYQRGGRLICAACDLAMGGGGFPELQGATSSRPVQQKAVWAFAGVTAVSLLLAGWALWHAQAMDAQAQVLSQRMDVVIGEIDLRWARLDTQQESSWASWSQAAAGDLASQGADWASRLRTMQTDVEAANQTVRASQEQLRTEWGAWLLAQQEAPKDDKPWLEAVEGLRKRIEDQRLANEEVWVVLADRLQNFEDTVKVPTAEPTAAEGAPWFALTKNLTSSVPGLRLEALFSLEQTRDRRVCSYLLPLLTDPDPLVRVASARVLKDHRYRRAVPILITGLEDPVLTVRVGFLDALHTITKRQFGYPPDGRESDRRRPLKDWQDWWKKMGDSFLTNDPG